MIVYNLFYLLIAGIKLKCVVQYFIFMINTKCNVDDNTYTLHIHDQNKK